ncbi:MAG: DUF3817 domain-containing protein [Opitutales bacterium]
MAHPTADQRLALLRRIGYLEGTSFLLLLGIAMPLKYLAGWPVAVQVIGLAHGLLFLAYVGLVLYLGKKRRWSWRKRGGALVASVLPFGPFVADARLFQRDDADRRIRVAYFYYFANFRSDAFLRTLASAAEELTVFDYVLLRKVFRRGKISHAKQQDHVATITREAGSARLRHFVCPAVSLGASSWRHGVSFALSTCLAACFALASPFLLMGRRFTHVVFYNGHPLYEPARAWARLLNLQIVTDLGDVLYLLENPNRLSYAAEANFIQTSNRVICVSKPFKDWLNVHLKIPPDRISVLSASLPEHFAAAFNAERNAARRLQLREGIGASEDDLVLTYAGGRWFRWVSGKGIIDVQGVDGLCNAIKQLNDEGITTHLVILGTPVDDPQLTPLVQGEWRHRFHLWGTYTPLDNRHTRALGGADLLCIPSAGSQIYQLYDRFKMYEYLAAGKTPVVAEVAINRDVFGDDAVYFADGDWRDMARAIRAELSRSIVFNNEYNRRAREHYNWDRRVSAGDVHIALFGPDVVERY